MDPAFHVKILDPEKKGGGSHVLGPTPMAPGSQVTSKGS